MTYNAGDEEDLRHGEDYVKLEGSGTHSRRQRRRSVVAAASTMGLPLMVGGWLWSLWWWVKLVLVVLFVTVLGVVFFKWIGPFFMDKSKVRTNSGVFEERKFPII